MSLLQVDNLRTYFRTTGEPRKVIDGISLSLAPSETLGIVGESGCGKSMTALSIMQLIPRPGYVAGGAMLFKGADIVQMTGPEKRGLRGRSVAMIFQEPMTSLNPVLTVLTQLLEAIRRARPGEGDDKLGRAALKAQRLARAVELLEMVEIPDPRRRLGEYPHQLSGGMRQRVMIAMALACQPDLLIADEPTTALDVTVEAKILDLLRNLQARLGTAIMFITHDLSVIAEISKRVAVMYAGKIVEMAPTERLFASPAHPYTQLLLRCRPSRGRRGEPLDTISGIVPDPRDFAMGCRFCDRCPKAFEPCKTQPPPPVELADDHMVECHLYNEQSREVINTVQTAPPPAPPAIELPMLDVRGLTMHFPIRKGILQRVVGHVRAVDGVDMTIPHGDTLALVGESGCGKTTLGKTLIRLLPATGGSIVFDGENVLGMNESRLRAFRRSAQIVFQDPYSSLNPRMMVREIIAEGMKVHGIGGDRTQREGRMRELMARVGLPAEAMSAYPHEFSGGQRQRIGVARALAVEPQFIVLDEPTSALDVSVQAQILNLLRELQGHGRRRLTYLFITHDLGVVEYLADEVAVMYLGRIVERATTEAIFDDALHPYTRALLSAIPGRTVAGGRTRLSGDVPSPSAPPSGCHFHPRCPNATDICRKVYPIATKRDDGRMVRCHLYE